MTFETFDGDASIKSITSRNDPEVNIDKIKNLTKLLKNLDKP